MNQDNYLAEALKMRNLVSEFNPPVYNDLTAAAGACAARAACELWAGRTGWQFAAALPPPRRAAGRAGSAARGGGAAPAGQKLLVSGSEWAESAGALTPSRRPPIGARAGASVAAARRPANGRELPLVVEKPGGDGVDLVRVGAQYLERPW